jgi:hypothetical protein
MEDNMSNKKSKTIRILIVEPGKAPYAAEIPAGLAALQEKVEGLIQALYPFDDPVVVIANDEGKLLGLPWNRPLFDEDGNIYDILVGTFLVVGLTEDDFGSLSDELIQKYTEVFRMGF